MFIREKIMKSVLVTIFITGMLTLVNNANALLWTDNGHNYEFVKFADKSRAAAATNMLTKFGTGYYLATITSQAEQDFIANTLLAGVTGEYWLGGSQPIGETHVRDNWSWDNGEDWGYDHWKPTEPNDARGPGSEQDLAMWKRTNWNWEWNDEGNFGNITGYIVEQNIAPVPEPATMLLFGTGLVGLAGIRLRKKKQ
jgi:hypothetical protein